MLILSLGWILADKLLAILFAHHNGIFANYGIDAKLVTCPGGSGQAIQKLQNGALDVSIGLTEAFVVGCLSSKNSCKIVGTYVQSHLCWSINTGKQSSYHTEEDLNGSVVGISNIGSGSHIMSYVFAKQETSKITKPFIFKVLNTFQKLIEAANSGEIAAFIWEYSACKSWPSYMIAANAHVLGKPVLFDFLNAINDGIVYFYQNNEKAIKYIVKNLHYLKEDVIEWLKTVEFSENVHNIPLDAIHQVASVLQKADLISFNITDVSSFNSMLSQKELENIEEDILKDFLPLNLCEKLNDEVFLKENFDVDKFLKKMYKFRTLEDLQIKLKELSKTIEGDIIAFVREKYDDFFKFADSIFENESKIIDLSIYLTKFKNEVEKIYNAIQLSILRIDEELQKKKEISLKKALSMNLLNINMMIEDMEYLSSLIIKEYEDEQSIDISILQELSKSYILLKYHLSLVSLHYPFVEERKEKIQVRSRCIGRSMPSIM
ncbi:hypothetical protein PMAC_000757 [Pneumocystis sp. 'macacae']|nr:hypothetical protein PMAC_000757 [Pneumocystis sp. 'macacae']